jgi:hypothetical protein
MLFEADHPSTSKDHVHVNKPDPEKHPDAYDEKGNLTEMYSDPEVPL